MKRRAFITLLGGAAVWPLAARAQQSSKLWRIGFLSAVSRELSSHAALEQGMHELGYVEGKDFVLSGVPWRGNTSDFLRLLESLCD